MSTTKIAWHTRFGNFALPLRTLIALKALLHLPNTYNTICTYIQCVYYILTYIKHDIHTSTWCLRAVSLVARNWCLLFCSLRAATTIITGIYMRVMVFNCVSLRSRLHSLSIVNGCVLFVYQYLPSGKPEKRTSPIYFCDDLIGTDVRLRVYDVALRCDDHSICVE